MWQTLEKNDVIRRLNTKEREGLTEEEVKIRQAKYGKNKLKDKKKESIIIKFIKQFNDFMIITLIIASIISAVISKMQGENDYVDSIIIIGIVIFNALMGVIQEAKAEKSIEALKQMTPQITKVIRNGKTTEINAEDLVKGDIVILETGNFIPADCRIIESHNLKIEESSLTGEAEPSLKEANIICKKDIPLGDMKNMAFMASTVVNGTGKAIVTETGMETKVGQIANMIIEDEAPETPIQRKLAQVGKVLGTTCLVICGVIFIIGLLKNIEPVEMFMTSVGLAVAAIPEGLPAIVTIVLSIGVTKMAKKNSIIRKLPAVETLGSSSVICSDKTGTLTQNKMEVVEINSKNKALTSMLACMCTDCDVNYKENKPQIQGEATEVAIVQNAFKLGFLKDDLYNKFPRVSEIPFDSTRKMMTTIHKIGNKYRIITKGALEEILKRCTTVKINGEHKDLTQNMIANINSNAKDLALQGMQVIALASKREYSGKDIFNSSDESEMVFIGFVAFLDPPKKDVKTTIKNLKEYGVTTKILTGDNQYATENVSRLVGIPNDKILTGSDIDKMSDDELSKQVEDVDIFARMNPLQKERIITILKKNGHVVGYMGDGVNDAPSLHNADVGICVNTATDIAKEASDIILLEKNLKVVFNGVVEGRKVYGNIIKYMKMALSSDFGDVFSIFIASIFLPFLPLLPIQMLLQDFLYDFSQIAIPYDNVDKEFLLKPRKWNTKGLGTFMNVMGPISSIIDVLAFLAFWFILGYNNIASESYFQTAWFVECLISETLIIHFVRTSKIPFVQSRANPILTALTMVTIIGTIITPILFHNISSFHFEILPPLYYLIVIGLTALYVVLVQIVKKIYIKKVGEWL